MNGSIRDRIYREISERMTDLYGQYASDRDDMPDKEDYFDGLLDAWHDISDMLDEVLEVEE